MNNFVVIYFHKTVKDTFDDFQSFSETFGYRRWVVSLRSPTCSIVFLSHLRCGLYFSRGAAVKKSHGQRCSAVSLKKSLVGIRENAGFV